MRIRSLDAVLFVVGFGEGTEPTVDLGGPEEMAGHEESQHHYSLGEGRSIS